MKLKNLSSAAMALLLLLLFLPVFYHVIMYGNNMNYNPDHKIYALYGNKVLLALVLIGVLAFLAVLYFVRKIPSNKYTVKGFVAVALLSCVAFYFVNVEVSKCIAFYGGWDCGMVADSARWFYEGGELGQGDYYYIFTNNVPIVWVLNKLYAFACEMKSYPYNPEFIWIQFQCLMHALTVFFSAMAVLVATGKVSLSAVTLIVNMVLLGLSPWKIIPYTDGTPIVFPVLVFFLYAVFLRMKSGWKYLVWLVVTYLGAIGGILKATCYVVLIAIVIVDFIWILINKEKTILKVRELAVRCGLLACGLALAMGCRNGMYRSLDYEYKESFDIGWLGFLYDGLNEESTGACSADAYEMVRNYAGESREYRDALMLQRVRERIDEKGFNGLMDFWLRKQVMTYNDGTFSWYQEGFFNAWAYENITDSSWKEPLRKFYWEDGANYPQFVTWSHGIWLFVLVGVIVEAVMVFVLSIVCMRKPLAEREKCSDLQISTVAMLTFIGVFLFLMLFEGRARYLYTNIPIFSIMAIMGYWKFVEFVEYCRTNWFNRQYS